MGREEFNFKVNREPGALETTMHFNKMREFIVSVRPDLEAESVTKRFSIVSHDKQGAVVGGAYFYTSIGSMVLELIWVEPEYRTKGLGLELMREVFLVARAEGCAQVIGTTADFLGLGEVYKRYGSKTIGVLEVPGRGYSVEYFCCPIDQGPFRKKS